MAKCFSLSSKLDVVVTLIMKYMSNLLLACPVVQRMYSFSERVINILFSVEAYVCYC